MKLANWDTPFGFAAREAKPLSFSSKPIGVADDGRLAFRLKDSELDRKAQIQGGLTVGIKDDSQLALVMVVEADPEGAWIMHRTLVGPFHGHAGTFNAPHDMRSAISLSEPVPNSAFETRVSGPVKFAQTLLSRWGLTPAQQAALLGLRTGEWRSIQLGLRPLSDTVDLKDRMRILSKIVARLRGLLNDNPQSEVAWLQQHSFEGRPLFDLIADARLVGLHNVLLTIESHASR